MQFYLIWESSFTSIDENFMWCYLFDSLPYTLPYFYDYAGNWLLWVCAFLYRLL